MIQSVRLSRLSFQPVGKINTQHVMLSLLEEWRENLNINYVAEGVLMDPCKAFDCVPYDLLLARLATYGVDESFLCYIHSYLLNRNNTFESVISIATF